jgi:hypothetical protein
MCLLAIAKCTKLSFWCVLSTPVQRHHFEPFCSVAASDVIALAFTFCKLLQFYNHHNLALHS